jgi:hypothetical protein
MQRTMIMLDDDLLRAGLQDQFTVEQPDRQCVGAEVCVYDTERCFAISVLRGTGTGRHSHVHAKHR